MKKYFSLLIIASLSLLANVQVEGQKAKVIETIRPFPYQHRAETDAALTAMATWDKSDWKWLMGLLDDDSLKLKATYALNAYVNIASLDAMKKNQMVSLLKKRLASAKT